MGRPAARGARRFLILGEITAPLIASLIWLWNTGWLGEADLWRFPLPNAACLRLVRFEFKTELSRVRGAVLFIAGNGLSPCSNRTTNNLIRSRNG
jgi:hypothetical protein